MTDYRYQVEWHNDKYPVTRGFHDFVTMEAWLREEFSEEWWNYTQPTIWERVPLTLYPKPKLVAP